MNKDFGLCSTYDQVLSVPALAPDSIVKGSAQFRSRQRLPVLTYLHTNAAAIVRCAQPMAGANNRSAEGKFKNIMFSSGLMIRLSFLSENRKNDN